MEASDPEGSEVNKKSWLKTGAKVRSKKVFMRRVQQRTQKRSFADKVRMCRWLSGRDETIASQQMKGELERPAARLSFVFWLDKQKVRRRRQW
ncbi:hypothetical protein TNCT_176151 [Trichonephila clavata]|uniref:Uncharacterized protein n=1 Tax=Trichonephila clavata TaxID=2740835 RepID=A0A8X6GV33_TRICU|nr:hypothetical protein TNCT_176151 [Trichonephila clavata]